MTALPTQPSTFQSRRRNSRVEQARINLIGTQLAAQEMANRDRAAADETKGYYGALSTETDARNRLKQAMLNADAMLREGEANRAVQTERFNAEREDRNKRTDAELALGREKLAMQGKKFEAGRQDKQAELQRQDFDAEINFLQQMANLHLQNNDPKAAQAVLQQIMIRRRANQLRGAAGATAPTGQGAASPPGMFTLPTFKRPNPVMSYWKQKYIDNMSRWEDNPAVLSWLSQMVQVADSGNEQQLAELQAKAPPEYLQSQRQAQDYNKLVDPVTDAMTQRQADNALRSLRLVMPPDGYGSLFENSDVEALERFAAKLQSLPDLSNPAVRDRVAASLMENIPNILGNEPDRGRHAFGGVVSPSGTGTANRWERALATVREILLGG